MHHEELQHLHFFKHIDTILLSKLASQTTLKHYRKGSILFNHGDNTEYFYIINSGWAKLFRNTSDGQEALIGLAKSGDIIGELNFNQITHLFSAEIIHDSEILLLPYHLLIDGIRKNGAFALTILKALNSNINLLELQKEHASTMNSAQRIACFILRLCKEEQKNIKVKLPCEKTLIASYLGMKRETFSRGLHELESVGIFVEGDLLTIKDVRAVIKFCCISCSLSYDSCMEK
jgi:CRP/FNR family transcriptional regulator, dissimilatory nitrate respiration regulator